MRPPTPRPSVLFSTGLYLVGARLRGIAPFGDLDVSFVQDDGEPRMATVVHGGPGVGKTMLLSALASTRPGHATVVPSAAASPQATRAPHVYCEWQLGDDDTERPHPLCVASPNAPVEPGDDAANLRRREQALYERRARSGGFVFVGFPGPRWFSRQAVSLGAPLRTLGRYDVKATAPLDDSSRFDLTRRTKQAMAYAAIASSLMPTGQRRRAALRKRPYPWRDTRLLGTATFEAVDAFVQLAGFRYDGLDPASLEPFFIAEGGTALPFDGLPTRARDLVAFAAVTIGALWAAYPNSDPRTGQAIVAIDDAALRQDSAVVSALIGTMRQTFPRVQWILTTNSAELAATCSDGAIALRRMADHDRVELYQGAQAQTH